MSDLSEAKRRLQKLISDDRSLERHFDKHSDTRKIDAIMKAQIAIINEMQKLKAKL